MNSQVTGAEPNAAAPKTKTPTDLTVDLDVEIDAFIGHIDALADVFPLTMAVVSITRSGAAQKLEEFEKAHCITTQEEGSRIVQVPILLGRQFSTLLSKSEKARLAEKTLPRSFVISLISHYDAFLGRLLRWLFITKPELLNASEKNISFAQLVEFGTVENAKMFLIEKEIEAVLRKSHAEQFDWLEAKFDVPLRKDLPIWKTFVELTERRNLFVHCGGVVSSQYRTVCGRHGFSPEELPKLDKELFVSSEYFKSAYSCIYEIGIKLAHVLWRKLNPQNRQKADQSLNGICYRLLTEEKYELGHTITDFATDTLKKYFDEETRLMFVVNRALAYKWSGNEKRARSIIEREDWSAKSTKFRLAAAVILDDYDAADRYVVSIGKGGEVTEHDYRDWPLFRAYRETYQFKEVYKQVFGSEFEHTNVTVPKAEALPNSAETFTEEVASLDDMSEGAKSPGSTGD